MTMTEKEWAALNYFRPTEKGWGGVESANRMSGAFMRKLDLMRLHAGAPMVVHAGWADSGHSDKSMHYEGRALDFHFGRDPQTHAELSVAEQFLRICSMRMFGGVGYYPYWNTPGWHIDDRARRPTLYWIQDGSGIYHYGLRAISSYLEIGL